jgi:hypothetical protein
MQATKWVLLIALVFAGISCNADRAKKQKNSHKFGKERVARMFDDASRRICEAGAAAC